MSACPCRQLLPPSRPHPSHLRRLSQRTTNDTRTSVGRASSESASGRTAMQACRHDDPLLLPLLPPHCPHSQSSFTDARLSSFSFTATSFTALVQVASPLLLFFPASTTGYFIFPGFSQGLRFCQVCDVMLSVLVCDLVECLFSSGVFCTGVCLG